MLKFSTLTLSSAFTAALTLSAQAETLLTVSTWASPNHLINSQSFPYMDKVLRECSGGDLGLKLEYGLASPPAQYDTIRDGVADISWIVPGYTPGKFTTMMLAELPGNSGNAEEISVAYQMTYDKFFAAAKEAKGVQVLANFVHGPGRLNMIEPLEGGIQSVAGKKIRIGSGVGAMMATSLEMAAVNVPATAVYETLASGVAEGVLFPAETLKSFRVDELVNYSYHNPDGMYTTAFKIILNNETYEGLSDMHRACVDELRGIDLAREIGRHWDVADQIVMDAIANGDSNLQVIELDANERAYFKEKTVSVEAQVLEQVTSSGIDGAAALEYLREQLN